MRWRRSQDGGDDAKVLAGGHSLIPLMKLRLAAPALLVDLRRVAELRGVDADNGVLRFGAMMRHHEVATGNYGLAAAAAATIADQQVRNRGTIGGTIAHGDPASDLPGDPAGRRRVGHGPRELRRSARSRPRTSSRTS